MAIQDKMGVKVLNRKRILNRINRIISNLILKADAGRVPTTELVNRIFSFCEIYSGKTLFPYQEQFSKRVIRSVLTNDGAEITALFARQSGKSETVATTVGGMMIILPTLANLPMFADDPRLMMFKDGLWVGIFAPSQRQAQITYGRLKARLQCKQAIAVLNDPEFNLQFDTSNGQTVSLTNGSFATAISASDGSSIEGESFKVIICEECQDISNYKIRKSIHPMGAAYNASIIKIGTATTFKGDFYDAIKRNKAEAEKKSTHIRDHFEYDCDVASKYNPKYAKYVDKERKRLGANSDEFRMSYKLEWIIERGMFIDIAKFELTNCEYSLDRVICDHQATHIAGIDVGGKGDDSTVVTITEVDWNMPVIMESQTDPETGEEVMYIAYNTYIKDWLCIKNVPDYEEQYAMIMDYLSHFRVVRAVVDATKESAVADRIKANANFEVIPYVFSSKSKSELYKRLEQEIDTGRARVCAGEETVNTPEYKDFMQQLGDLQKGYSGAYLVVSHPAEKGAHDDYPDSWALSVWGSSFKGEVNETETKKNKFTERTKRESTFNSRRNKLTSRRR